MPSHLSSRRLSAISQCTAQFEQKSRDSSINAVAPVQRIPEPLETSQFRRFQASVTAVNLGRFPVLDGQESDIHESDYEAPAAKPSPETQKKGPMKKYHKLNKSQIVADISQRV